MQDLSPTLAAIAVLAILPLILWAEAFWRGSSRIKLLTTLLLVSWYFAIVMVSLPELLCDGSVLNVLSNCRGPLGPDALMRFLVVGPALPLIPIIYVGSVVLRILRGQSK
jgi:hypothetical protein